VNVKNKVPTKRLTTMEMEIALAHSLDFRKNLIVPNISWGMNMHECDLLVLTKAGYAWEVEIKITKADLVKDKDKRHGHHHPKIKRLYFAIPDYLTPHIKHIPERAGIITVDWYHRCKTIREPQQNSGYKFSEAERYNIARLGAMRIWTLKKRIVKRKK